MDSPPSSPSNNLHGASRTIGGIFRGQAHGNVFNFADGLDSIMDVPSAPLIGKVHLFLNKSDVKPTMSIKHEVTSQLAPVLHKIAGRYSPVRSKFLFHTFVSFLIHLHIEFNRRIYVRDEEEIWSVRGRFNTALEDDEAVNWIVEKGDLILPVLIVSHIMNQYTIY
jgi:hypothetical protein